MCTFVCTDHAKRCKTLHGTAIICKCVQNENALHKGKMKRTAKYRGSRFGGGEENRTVRQSFENAVIEAYVKKACAVSCDVIVPVSVSGL